MRLFALGLSGGILASVFNSLAAGMSPDNAIAGPIVMVLIFLIGHSINMFYEYIGSDGSSDASDFRGVFLRIRVTKEGVRSTSLSRIEE